MDPVQEPGDWTHLAPSRASAIAGPGFSVPETCLRPEVAVMAADWFYGREAGDGALLGVRTVPDGAGRMAAWSRQKDTAYMLPDIPFGEKVRDAYGAIMQDVGSYADGCIARLVSGDMPLEELPQVRQRLRDMGIEEAIAIRQTLLDNYTKEADP